MNAADLSIVLSVAVIAVVKATPLVYAGLGGVVSENAGVLNIGLEGMMVGGAFAAVIASYASHDLALAVLAAAATGAFLGLVLAYFAVTLRANQVVVGMALNVLCLGAASFLLSVIFGQPGASPAVASFPNHFNVLAWGALCAVVATHVVLNHTKLGRHLRAVGEEPRAAVTAGIDVARYRYGAAICGGILAALGGAYLSIGEVDLYSDGMVAGRGFIALAAVIFGRWTPLGTAGACLFFGLFSGLQIALQQASVPAQLLQMLPYVLTIVAISGLIGRSRAPAADGVPFEA